MIKRLKELFKDEGAGIMVEYALALFLLGLASVGMDVAFKMALQNFWNKITNIRTGGGGIYP